MKIRDVSKLTIDFHGTEVGAKIETRIINTEKVDSYNVFITLLDAVADYVSNEINSKRINAYKFMVITLREQIEEMEQRERERAN